MKKKKTKNPTGPALSRKPARRPGTGRSPADAARSYRDLLLRLPVGVYRTTPEGRILEANPALARMLGHTQAELKRKRVADLYIRKTDRERSLEALAGGAAEFTEFDLRRGDGRIIRGRDYCRPKRDASGRVLHYDGILVDITEERRTAERLIRAHARLRATTAERKQMILKLESLSITDEMTGLFNRRGFHMLAERQLAVAARKKGPVFLLYLDMDNLKHINDVFGHHVGDLAIIRVASIVKASFRSSDIMGRMGGDEFAVFPIDAGPEGIEAVLARLRKDIETANAAPDAVFKLSISIGIAAFDPARPSSVEELLIRADSMMYEEKRKKEV